MKWRKMTTTLLFCLVLLFVLTSCLSGDNPMIIELSPSSITLPNLASKIYTHSELITISEHNGTIHEINVEYPIECVRYKEGIYRVTYLGQEEIAIVVYDSMGNKLLSKICCVQLAKEDFLHLNSDMNVDKMQRFDPYGEFYFLYTGRNDVARESIHYTRDGYIVTIKYNEENVAVKVNVEPI